MKVLRLSFGVTVAVKALQPKNILLEEYISLFPIDFSTSGFNYKRFKENIQSLITIAHDIIGLDN